ncbi:MAG: amino acid ABC transporter permease [Dichotomicrobium sp.]
MMRLSRGPERRLLIQAVALAAMVWLGWEVVANTAENLAQRNIASGFGFLWEPAGFDISQSLIPYDEGDSYARAFLVGLLNTLVVAAIGILLATVLGLVIGVARLSRNWLIRNLAAGYIELLRNIPLLLQLFFWYFAVLRQLPPPRDSVSLGAGAVLNNRGLYLPALETGANGWPLYFALLIAVLAGFGVHHVMRAALPMQRRSAALATGGIVFAGTLWLAALGGAPIALEFPALRGLNFGGGVRILPEFVALVLALALYTAAFIAEIVRAGLQSVEDGQIEAAYALGLRPRATLRFIVLPQALRLIVPPLTSQYLNLTKNSSLAVAIAYPDLVSVFAGTTLSQTEQAVEVLLITMAVYLLLSLLTALAMNIYNARMLALEARA